MAGPVCGLMLADMGADVIKVERVPDGDPVRRFLPPDVDGEPAAFMMLNRNKRGIAVDLKTPGGVDVVRRLLADADVVIENFRPGAMNRMGLGYDELRRDNPRLVYCQITGFGTTGPLAEHGGFDLIAQGYSGLMSVTGEGPGRPPVKCGPPLTDITAGILAAMGVLAAIVQRERTGRGRRVETSLFEAGITHTFWQSAIALATGTSPGPLGSAHPLSAPYQAFETSDGWINIGASSQASWERLPEALDMPELLADARFAHNADRMAHLPELVAALAPRLRERTTAQWLERLERAGVPAGPVLSIDAMLHHPQTAARGMLVEVEHSRLGPVETLGFPVKFDTPAGGSRRGAPLLGEHTRAVLRELGYEAREVAALIEAAAVIARPEEEDLGPGNGEGAGAS